MRRVGCRTGASTSPVAGGQRSPLRGARSAARSVCSGASRPGGQGRGADATDVSANGNPAAQKAAQDAIPLTPEMIEELARRYNATQQAAGAGRHRAGRARSTGRSTSPSRRGWRPASSRRSRAIRRRSLLRQHRPALADPVGHQLQSRGDRRRHELQRADQRQCRRTRPRWRSASSSARPTKGRTSWRSRRSRWRRAAVWWSASKARRSR